MSVSENKENDELLIHMTSFTLEEPGHSQSEAQSSADLVTRVYFDVGNYDDGDDVEDDEDDEDDDDATDIQESIFEDSDVSWEPVTSDTDIYPETDIDVNWYHPAARPWGQVGKMAAVRKQSPKV